MLSWWTEKYSSNKLHFASLNFVLRNDHRNVKMYSHDSRHKDLFYLMNVERKSFFLPLFNDKATCVTPKLLACYKLASTRKNPNYFIYPKIIANKSNHMNSIDNWPAVIQASIGYGKCQFLRSFCRRRHRNIYLNTHNELSSPFG